MFLLLFYLTNPFVCVLKATADVIDEVQVWTLRRPVKVVTPTSYKKLVILRALSLGALFFCRRSQKGKANIDSNTSIKWYGYHPSFVSWGIILLQNKRFCDSNKKRQISTLKYRSVVTNNVSQPIICNTFRKQTYNFVRWTLYDESHSYLSAKRFSRTNLACERVPCQSLAFKAYLNWILKSRAWL